MKAWPLLISIMITPLVSYAGAEAGFQPVEHVDAPGGDLVYYVMEPPGNKEDAYEGRLIGYENFKTSKAEVLLKATEGEKPEDNLTGFSHLVLSPDSKVLYFETTAWATSNAIHALNVATKKTSFITDGSLECVVGSGQYQGDLIAWQHRYFVQGGSYNFAYLYDSTGKEIGLVGTDNMSKVDMLKACQSMG